MKRDAQLPSDIQGEATASDGRTSLPEKAIREGGEDAGRTGDSAADDEAEGEVSASGTRSYQQQSSSKVAALVTSAAQEDVMDIDDGDEEADDEIEEVQPPPKTTTKGGNRKGKRVAKGPSALPKGRPSVTAGYCQAIEKVQFP